MGSFPSLHKAIQSEPSRNIMLRDTIKAAQVTAMKAGDKTAPRRCPPDPGQAEGQGHRTAHRLASQPDDDVLVVDVLQKMAKQRRESITLYRTGRPAGTGRSGKEPNWR
jgi:uncharacterized protein YqeY